MRYSKTTSGGTVHPKNMKSKSKVGKGAVKYANAVHPKGKSRR